MMGHKEEIENILEIIDSESYVFSFGKFRNFSYAYVLKTDPFYIQWCTQTMPGFYLNDTDNDILNEFMKNHGKLSN